MKKVVFGKDVMKYLTKETVEILVQFQEIVIMDALDDKEDVLKIMLKSVPSVYTAVQRSDNTFKVEYLPIPKTDVLEMNESEALN